MFPSNIPGHSVRAFGVLCLWLVASLAVQAQNPSGALRGVVQDSSGARVASASVSVASAEQALLRETQTDARGEDVKIARFDAAQQAAVRAGKSPQGAAAILFDQADNFRAFFVKIPGAIGLEFQERC